MDISVTRAVYRFEELSEDAKWRAIEVLSEQAWDDLDSYMVSEDLTTRFAWEAANNDGGPYSRKAFRDRFGIDIEWSVGYSQSDYAAVTGYLDRVECPHLAWPNDVRAIRVRSNNYHGSTVVDVFVGDDYDYAREQADWDAASEMIANLNRTIYKWARQACEDYTSTDYVIFFIQASGVPYQWNEDGTQAPAIFWRES